MSLSKRASMLFFYSLLWGSTVTASDPKTLDLAVTVGEETLAPARISRSVKTTLHLVKESRTNLSPLLSGAAEARLSKPLTRKSALEIALLNSSFLQRFLEACDASQKDLEALGFLENPGLSTLFPSTIPESIDSHSQLGRFLRVWRFQPGSPNSADQEAMFSAVYKAVLDSQARVQQVYTRCLLAEAKLKNGKEIEKIINNYLTRILNNNMFGFANSQVVESARDNLRAWSLEIERRETQLLMARSELATVLGVEKLGENLVFLDQLEEAPSDVKDVDSLIEDALKRRLDLKLIRMKMTHMEVLSQRHEKAIKRLQDTLLALNTEQKEDIELAKELKERIAFKEKLTTKLKRLHSRLAKALKQKEAMVASSIRSHAENLHIFRHQVSTYSKEVIPSHKEFVTWAANQTKHHLHPTRSVLPEAWTLLYESQNKVLTVTADSIDAWLNLENLVTRPLAPEPDVGEG